MRNSSSASPHAALASWYCCIMGLTAIGVALQVKVAERHWPSSTRKVQGTGALSGGLTRELASAR